MDIESKDVIDFFEYMSKKYNFMFISKSDAIEMKMINWALEQMNIMEKDVFLKKYSTTVCVGAWRSVYIPFEIGKGTKNQLIGQIETCAHESQHIVQADRDPRQPLKYLISDSSRANYEADALRATMEMHYFLTGKMLSPKTLANTLSAYSIGSGDRRVAEKHLIIAKKAIEKGGIITGTSKESIRWFKQRKIAPIRRIVRLTF